MGSGTEDEDSAVRKFSRNAIEMLERLAMTRTSLAIPRHSTPSTTAVQSPPPAAHHKPVNWLAVVAVIGPLATAGLAFTWTGGARDKTLDTVELTVSTMAIDFKTAAESIGDNLDSIRDENHVLAEALSLLAGEVDGLRSDYQLVARQLAKIEGMQNAQALQVATLSLRMESTVKELERIEAEAIKVKWTTDHNSKYVHTLKEQMRTLWDAGGFKPMTEDQGDG